MSLVSALALAEEVIANGDVVAQTLAAFEKKEKTFTVWVGPVAYTFRHCEDYEEIDLFKESVVEFASMVRDWRAVPGSEPKGWRVPKNDKAAAAAFTVHYWSADPTPISQKAACDLLRTPWALQTLIEQIDDRQGEIDDVFAQAVAAAKKASSETAGDGSGSK